MQTQVRNARRAVRVGQVNKEVGVRSLQGSRLRRVTVSSVTFNLFGKAFMVTFLHTRSRLKLTSQLIRRVSPNFIFSKYNDLTLRVVRAYRHFVMNNVNADQAIVSVRNVNGRPCQTERIISCYSIHNRDRGNFQLSNLVQNFNARHQFPVSSKVPSSDAGRTANRVQRSLSIQDLRYLRHNVYRFSGVAINKRSSERLSRPVNFTIIQARLHRKVRTSRTMSAPHSTGFDQFRSRHAKATSYRALMRTS